MKKETLEEIAERLYPTDYGIKSKDIINIIKQDTFIKGAKWSQERSYSEGDLREAYFSAIKSTGEGWNGEYANGNNPNIEEKFTEGFEEWFEQFKKK